MKSILVAESGDIPASPEAVYAILADYHAEHPHILPQRYFKRLEIERGGQGAGTIFRTTTRVLGTTTVYRMVVSEPEPGRVLVETDAEQGVFTTFTVTPASDAQGANLRIATAWPLHDGLRGGIERILYPLAARPIQRAELRQFADYVQGKRQTAPEKQVHDTEQAPR